MQNFSAKRTQVHNDGKTRTFYTYETKYKGEYKNTDKSLENIFPLS